MKLRACPNKKCNFWREKIVPQIFNIIKHNIKPEFIEMDKFSLEDIIKNSRFTYLLIDFYPANKNKSEFFYWSSNENKTSIFSWSLMMLQLALLYNRFNVEWDRNIRKCPACGFKLKSKKINNLFPIIDLKVNFEKPKPLNVTSVINQLIEKNQITKEI